MKKRGLADWLSLLLHGVVGLGFLLFALQFLMLGLIRRGPHGEVRDRPWFVPRRIEDAAEVGGRIYILYRDSGAVNVYDGQGQFLWAISIPWHDHDSDVRLRVGESSLYLYQRRYDVYQFDRETGELKNSFPWEGREEDFPDERAPGETKEAWAWTPGEGCYDDLTVYRAREDGQLQPLIHRGGWVLLFYFTTAWALGFFGMIGVILVENTLKPALRERVKKKNRQKNGKDAGAQE